MTYSIVARDPMTGALGIAVQSHFFGVGPVVPWLEPGVGAVATQATANVAFGPMGLRLLRAGRPAGEVVAELVASDAEADVRQVAVVDAAGRAAAFTGRRCIRDAGHLAGDGYTVQGNLLRTPQVWPEMARAYERSVGAPFWERLLAALDAGEAAGGDVRGRQSAALVVVGAERTSSWEHRLSDVRVDDHPDPLGELRRLARMSEAYRLMGELEAPTEDPRPVEERYAAARRLAPDAVELVFWRAIELGMAGDLDAARRELAIALADDPTWAEALRRVADAGLAGDDPELVDRLLRRP
jgi:uncharacterized Ntn-hydrolase superfamily protein